MRRGGCGKGPAMTVPVSLRLTEARAADPARGWVAASHYAIIVRGVAVGSITLRHGRDATLVRYAGQVGYTVAAAHRGYGHACAALRALVPIARAAGFAELWITCAPDNHASRRTLERAGAALVERVALPPDSDMYARGEREKLRFRIDVGTGG